MFKDILCPFSPLHGLILLNFFFFKQDKDKKDF